MNTFATVVVYFLVALFVLHLVEGDATSWIMSKFNRISTTNNPTASGSSGTTIPWTGGGGNGVNPLGPTSGTGSPAGGGISTSPPTLMQFIGPALYCKIFPNDAACQVASTPPASASRGKPAGQY